MNPSFPALDDLGRICRTRPIIEKWLVAPSRQVGIQWLDRLARQAVPVLNVHVFSLRALALSIAAPAIAAAKATPVMGSEAAWWLDLAWRMLPDQQRGSLTSQDARPALSDAARRSLDAIQLSGIDCPTLQEALDPRQSNPDANPIDLARESEGRPDSNVQTPLGLSKSQQLSALLSHYLELLGQHRRLDYAGVLEFAIQEVRQHGLPRDVLLLAPADVEQWQLERGLLEAVPSNRIVRLSSAVTCQAGADHRLFSWLDQPAEAPTPAMDGSVEIYQAVGEANEVREAFRRILAKGCPLDEVELLHVNSEIYVPLCFELAQTWCDDERPNGVPVTFSEGVPIRYSRPGRALLHWLRWIGESCPQRILVDMYQEGMFASLPRRDIKRLPHREPPPTPRQLAKLLRETAIGMGRERYLDALDLRIAAARTAFQAAKDADNLASSAAPHASRSDAAATTVTPPRDSDRLSSKGGARRRLLYLRILRRHIKRLLAVAPEQDGDPNDVIDQIDRFLVEHTHRTSSFDGASLKQLRRGIGDVRRWIKAASGVQPPGSPGADWTGRTHWNVWDWLSHLVIETHAHQSGPRPGAVHVSPALLGGHSGRRHTHVLGLDDTKFPGVGLQDPVLLDEERQRISEWLPRGSDEPQRRIQRLAETFGRVQGHVTLSCASESLTDDRSLYPSPVLRTAARLVGLDESEWRRPASFAPLQAQRALTETEWWLAHFCQAPGNVAESQLADRYPHLGRGWRAANARFGSRLSQYNGWVPDAAAALSPIISPDQSCERGWSASAMETAGACPLRFFFKYGLKIRPLEEWSTDEDRWLDPLQFGSLLHEVFRGFMADCAAKNESPVFDLHHYRLADVLREAVTQHRAVHPPPSESAFRQQLRLMQLASRIFLEEEERHCRDFAPRFFEAAIGVPAESPGGLDALPMGQASNADGSNEALGGLDVETPMIIQLPDGRQIPAVGRVDRVDEHRDAPHQFQIWDYKTGSSSKYQANKPFLEGRHVQNTFYQLLVERALIEQVARDASVSGFGYFFPSATTWGQRLSWTASDLAEGPRVLGLLADVMGSGAYLSTWKSNVDCEWCDYKEVCGDNNLYRLSIASKLQAENCGHDQANGMAAWKELKNVK